MNSQYLREYLVFARVLNYSLAAKELYVTRPTLQSHIVELEKELGCCLVESQQGSLVLTLPGKRFVQRAEEILAVVTSTVKEFGSMAQNLLQVTIATTNLPWLESILFKARQHIQENYSHKQIEIVTVGGPWNTLRALSEAKNDIVVVGCKHYLQKDEKPCLPAGMSAFLLQTEEVKFLVTCGNPLFNKEAISAKDLDGQGLLVPPDLYGAYLRDKVPEHLAQLGAQVSLQTAPFSEHAEYFSFDFKAKIGIVPSTLIPRFGIDQRSECRTFSLGEFPFYSDFYAVYKDIFAASENGGLLIREMRNSVGE